jgi:gamma-D-glutamyl-L-lysine dipeptidyl-peptidase
VQYAVAKKSIVKVMKRPTDNSELIDEVLHGHIVEILQCLGKWVKIKTHYNYIGYCYRSDFNADKNIIKVYKSYKKSFFINNNSVDIKKSPSIKSKCIKNLTKGCLVSVIEEEKDDFLKIILASKDVGYIKRKFISPYVTTINYNEEEFRNNIIYTAKQYLGTQYRWGGKTTRGIDCSGLVSISYILKKGFP